MKERLLKIKDALNPVTEVLGKTLGGNYRDTLRGDFGGALREAFAETLREDFTETLREDFSETLSEGLSETLIGDVCGTLSETQARQFEKYYELLVQKNEVMNLTAITEFDEVLIKHFLDSCEAAPLLHENASLIDVGTGAGFPGIPIKIVRPDVKVCLLDALAKRIDFLKEVVEALSLEGVDCLHGRAEDFAGNGSSPKLRESFDYAVSRAVAQLSVLAEYCLPFVKVGGFFIAYKSGDIEEELAGAAHALEVLGGKVSEVKRFSLPNGDERSLVLIQKISETPAAYPRRAGKPTKKPL